MGMITRRNLRPQLSAAFELTLSGRADSFSAKTDEGSYCSPCNNVSTSAGPTAAVDPRGGKGDGKDGVMGSSSLRPTKKGFKQTQGRYENTPDLQMLASADRLFQRLMQGLLHDSDTFLLRSCTRGTKEEQSM